MIILGNVSISEFVCATTACSNYFSCSNGGALIRVHEDVKKKERKRKKERVTERKKNTLNRHEDVRRKQNRLSRDNDWTIISF